MMTTRSKWLLAAGILLALAGGTWLLAAGLAGQGPKALPGTLRFNLQTEPPSLDWHLATDNASIRVLLNIMEGLTRFDEKMRPVPGLAESWEALDEGHRYLFHLRPNAKWGDGRPVTAQDFVFAWRRLMDPKTAGEYAYFLYMVKNAEAINSGKEKDLTTLGVRAVDPLTLEIELSRPVVFFPMITAFIATFPMREDVVKKWGEKWTEPGNIVTCGPYRLQEWRHEYRIVLDRNPGYFGPKPGLDRIIFYMVAEQSTDLSLYQTGDLDAVEPLPSYAVPFYEKSPEYTHFPYFGSYYYGFNVKKPPVNDPRVRAALAMSIDRQQIPEFLKQHQIPNPTFIPIGMEFANPKLGRDFNPAEAQKLLAEAGYPRAEDLPVIGISYNTLEDHKLIAEFVQQQWKQNLGIRVELRNMEWKVFLKELQLDPPQVFRMGWIADYPDPDSFLTVFLSNSGNNYTRWASPEYDDLVQRAAVETAPQARQELYNRAQQLLCQKDAAIIPLYTYSINLLVKPWVKDYPKNGLDLLDFRPTRIVTGAP